MRRRPKLLNSLMLSCCSTSWGCMNGPKVKNMLPGIGGRALGTLQYCATEGSIAALHGSSSPQQAHSASCCCSRADTDQSCDLPWSSISQASRSGICWQRPECQDIRRPRHNLKMILSCLLLCFGTPVPLSLIRPVTVRLQRLRSNRGLLL